jgi:Secretion system C-terminal sorting domain
VLTLTRCFINNLSTSQSMNKFYTLIGLVCLCLTGLTAQTTILNFEAPATSTVFSYFGGSNAGGTTTVVANPSATGINTSANVMQMVKPANSEVWAGADSNPNPTTAVNVVNGGLIKVKVRAAQTGTFSLKLEGGGPNWLQTQNITVANQWVELVFNTANNSLEGPNLPAAGNTYSKVVFFGDFGTSSAADRTYYVDDMTVCCGTTPPAPVNVTFNVDMNNYTGSYTNVYVSGSLNGWSGNANQLTDANADGIFTGTLPLLAGNYEYKFTLDNWAGQETFSPGGSCTITTGAFTNRFLAVTAAATLPVFCFNSCFDCSYVPPALVDLPITFDLVGQDYTVIDFGGNMSTSATTGPAGSNGKVCKTIKTAGAELWAGTTMSTGAGLMNNIPLTATNKKMTVRVYSPIANAPIRLKIEESGDPTHSVETEAISGPANTWTTLTFDFANQAPGTAALNLAYAFDKASIFFNFGTTGAASGEKTYYFDDVKMFNVVAPPTIGFKAYKSGSGHLYWNPLTSVTKYQVQYRLSTATTWISSNLAPTLTYKLLATLSPTSTYVAQVRGIVAAGDTTPWSTQITFQAVGVAPCASPISFTAIGKTSTTELLLWPYATAATKYGIRYKKVSETAYVIKGTVTSKLDLLGLTPATDYTYQIRTYCAGVWMPWSASQTFTTLPGAALMGTEPQYLTADVFPNPSLSFIELNNLSGQVCNLNIIGVDGRNAMTVNNYDGGKIDIAGLNNGVYFIQIQAIDGETSFSTIQFVKQ